MLLSLVVLVYCYGVLSLLTEYLYELGHFLIF